MSTISRLVYMHPAVLLTTTNIMCVLPYAGLNMLNQAREFNAVVPLDGLVLTKLDGTARGGAVIRCAQPRFQPRVIATAHRLCRPRIASRRVACGPQPQ